MRRWCFFLSLGFGLTLVACGGGSSSPTANGAATTTRSVEQTQVSAVLTPADNGSVVPRGTAGVGSPSSILVPTSQTARPPSASAAAPSGTSPAAPSATASQVVKVTASDGANLRDKPDANGQVVATLDYGTEAPVLESNVLGADGTSKWFHVSYAGKMGFIRSDLVTGPQAPSPPQPPTAAASPGPTATPKP
jgi:uncharacterized protein YgiM (DUF1202 family)